MLVFDRYILRPYVCYHCRTDRLPCVDTMREDDDNPNMVEHIYFCYECLLHAARIVAPKVGQAVIPQAVIDGMEAAIKTSVADAEAARAEAALAVAARDSVIASIVANPVQFEEAPGALPIPDMKPKGIFGRPPRSTNVAADHG